MGAKKYKKDLKFEVPEYLIVISEIIKKTKVIKIIIPILNL